MAIPAHRLKFYRRVKALMPLAETSHGGVERVILGVLYSWQQEKFPHLAPNRIPYGTSRFISEPPVKDFVVWLAGAPFNDAAYWLATTYAILVGEQMRTERALFFTPPLLADRVIDSLVGHGASLTSQHWHDPACGGAAFLVPIVQRMQAALAAEGLDKAQQLAHIASHLSGNDLDPALLNLSMEFLRMAVSDLISATDLDLNIKLYKGDGLTSSNIEALKPDVLACNPPYRKLSATEVQRYQRCHGEIIEGQPNVYGLFINRTLQLAKQGGLIGLLTPTSFLSGQSFSKLRAKLLTHADTLLTLVEN